MTIHNDLWTYREPILKMIDDKTLVTENFDVGLDFIPGGPPIGSASLRHRGGLLLLPEDLNNPNQTISISFFPRGIWSIIHLGTAENFRKFTAMTPEDAFLELCKKDKVDYKKLLAGDIHTRNMDIFPQGDSFTFMGRFHPTVHVKKEFIERLVYDIPY